MYLCVHRYITMDYFVDSVVKVAFINRSILKKWLVAVTIIVSDAFFAYFNL